MVIPGYLCERLPEQDDLLGRSHRGVVGVRGSAQTPQDLMHVPRETLHGSEEEAQVLHRPKISMQQQTHITYHERMYVYVCMYI